MKSRLSLLAIAVSSGAALALLSLVFAGYRLGIQPSGQDLEGAAELGAAIGAVLTFTWPIRLLVR